MVTRLRDAKLLRDMVEIVLLCAALVAVFCARIESIPFHGDESQWIATSVAFEKFVKLQFSSPVWQESFWTLTQPPVARYFIGLGRRLGGHKELNLPWRFNVEEDRNIAEGRRPSQDLLWWSRLPMAFLSALAICVGFVLVRLSAGRMAGYAWAGLGAISSYLTVTLGRATGEAPLLAAILCAAWAGERALRALAARGEPNSHRRALLWFGAMGFFGGVAGASKLNGLAAVLAGVLLCLAGLCRRRWPMQRRKILFALGAVALLVTVAALTFVGLNPYLYPDPLARTVRMLEHRLTEMAAQQMDHPEDRVPGGLASVEIFVRHVLDMHAAIPGMPFVAAGLSAVGLAYLVRKSWLWLCGASTEAAPLALLVVGAVTAAPSLWSPLSWGRYYLLAVVFSTACMAVALGHLATTGYSLVKAQRSR